MKIAIVNQPWDKSPNYGGIKTSTEVYTYNIASRLAHDHAVIVYCSGRKLSHRIEADQYEGIEYRAVPGTAFERRMNLPLQKLFEATVTRRDTRRPFLSSRYFFMAYAEQIARDLRQQRADIIQVNNFYQFIPAIRAQNPDSKIVLAMHCEWLSQLTDPQVERALSMTDVVAAVSDHVRDRAAERFPQYAECMVTVHAGVKLPDAAWTLPAASPERKQQILFVGRISPEKGVHLMIEAFKQVHRARPDTELVLIGALGSAPAEFIVKLSDDPKVQALLEYYDLDSGRDIYFDRLNALITEDVRDAIVFRGPMPHADVIQAYANADIVLNASLSDAFPFPVLEAMGRGVPMVASAVGGIPETVVPGETGLLFEPGNVAQLAESVLALLADDALRLRMSQNARERIANNFMWEHTAHNLNALYAQMVEKVV